MSTGELVDRLVTDLRPVRKGAVPRRLFIGLGAGTGVSVILMLGWLGLRPDLNTAIATPEFWMKFAYTVALASAALWAVRRLAYPGGKAGGAAIISFAAVGAMVAIAVVQLGFAAPAQWTAMILGSTATVCPWRIVVLSSPIAAGALWAMRGLAPTDLVTAGAATGLVSGALGAWIYSFACNENAAPFVAVWYTIGALSVCLLGTLSGRRLLRW